MSWIMVQIVVIANVKYASIQVKSCLHISHFTTLVGQYDDDWW